MQARRFSAWRWLLPLALFALDLGCPPPQPPRPPGVALEVVNNSSEEIMCLYVSPQSSDSWGDDLLGAANTVAPGETYTAYVPPGTYDLMVEAFPPPESGRTDCPSGSEIGRRMGVTLNEDSQWVLYDE
ncbi:MAG: hypothetical protein HY905_16615 [Deltaproteobacteria bacterium]|nr:hypothetical protein [Deltaproteobacteria bacterium]